MNYKLLETFAILSKTRNVTKTAEKLYLSQSTVSYRLKALEDELGVILVERDRGFKEIQLTDHGEEFMKIAIDWENINEKIKYFSTGSFRKTLTIGVVDSVNNYLFSEVYKNILQNQTNIQLTVKTQHTTEIYEQVSNRIIDVGFVLHDNPMPQIKTHEILKEEMVLVTRNTFTSLQIEPFQLDPNNQIFLNWGDQYMKWHNDCFSSNATPRFNTDSALLSFDVLQEDMWLIVPLSVASVLSKIFNDINILTFGSNPPFRSIYMIANKNPLHFNKEFIEKFKGLVSTGMEEQQVKLSQFRENLVYM